MTARIAGHCHALRPGAFVVSVSRAVPCAGLQLLGRRRLTASWGESTVYYQQRLADDTTLAADVPQRHYSRYSAFNALADDNSAEQVALRHSLFAPVGRHDSVCAAAVTGRVAPP